MEDTITRAGPFSSNRLNVEIDSGIHQVVARLGMAFGEEGNSLVYLKGGWAGASISTFATERPFFAHDGSSEEDHDGWVAGIGYEIAINRMFSIGLEYNYLDLSSETHFGFDSINFAPYAVDVDPDGVHSILLRINMNLGWII